jgi:NADPH-dependent glutamate synthase beta subunit-like oxidoreductase/NAD-dependent dihydropyrimidine dehydrogenase PreA subunit
MAAMAKGISVIGSGIRATQCALTLAEMGIDVSLITPAPSLELENGSSSAEPTHELLHVWPLLLRATSHPRIKLYTNTQIKSVSGKPGDFTLKAQRDPRYVKEDLCTGCGKCEEVCSVKVQTRVNGHKVVHNAIHSSVLGAKSVPSAYYIDKEGISPCRADCPLGINVQGYVALLAKGKVDKAQALINEVAPMSSILGRLCTHPCELNCSRQKVDSPVYIQSLHRYIADNASGGINYQTKNPAGQHKEKIAIIGSGPAGLTAAWELARRGYTPTIFESHAVVGGMLATGIPRFRLPREVREKEVEAIKRLGVDIKTGVTVGRDVTYADLLDRGYKAFFLAIGAQQNNKLNIPGEDLNGVLDCISLLFSLNLKVGASVGANVIVIGGGNSAVDSARSAKRASKGDVRILCVTEAMTAVREDVDEALKEGIPIDYNVSAVEILGDGSNVTGVRCQKVKNVTFDAEGKINMEYIPGSEFVVKADHIVVAIGQRPNSSVLNIKNLNIGRNSTIKADPLTLETDIPGIFAGGDAVTGSNNVVKAMAAGLRAAESINRYLRGHDLKKGRSLESPKPVEVKIEERKPSADKRTKMPALTLAKRRANYEETNLGLTEDMALREAGRCINCAVCCECLECEQACELKAVYHQDVARTLEIASDGIINFVSSARHLPELKKAGVFNVPEIFGGNMPGELAQASTIALSAAIEIKNNSQEKPLPRALGSITKSTPLTLTNTSTRDHTVVFLCQCGGGVSSILDFSRISEAINEMPGIHSVQTLPQSCTPEGAARIKDFVTHNNIRHVVLAACRCCNLEQICFSCTDRRVMCQHNLSVELPEGVNIEFVNIREQCAWVHRDDLEGATDKALELISTGVIRSQRLAAAVYTPRAVVNGVSVIGTGISGLAAAYNLAIQNYPVSVIFDLQGLRSGDVSHPERINRLLLDLTARGVPIYGWPQVLKLNGIPGKYQTVFQDINGSKNIESGSVILDFVNARKEILDILADSNLISRVLARQHHFSRVSSLDSTIVHSFTVRETAGIFNVVPAGDPDVDELIRLGEAAAARASVYLNQESFLPRSSSVVIKEKLCRGCGDCVKLCPYIELKTSPSGICYAYVDPALCFGCGACISVCPTGAITQPLQSEVGIIAALESLMKKVENVSKIG